MARTTEQGFDPVISICVRQGRVIGTLRRTRDEDLDAGLAVMTVDHGRPKLQALVRADTRSDAGDGRRGGMVDAAEGPGFWSARLCSAFCIVTSG